MPTLVTLSDNDLSTLAELVSKERPDLPDAGLPLSLLNDVMAQIACDGMNFDGYDSPHQKIWLHQGFTGGELDPPIAEGSDSVHWTHYWDCLSCSYPDRSGDLRSIVRNADFYSRRQWHSTGMYNEIYRPQGLEHDLQLCLPGPPGPDGHRRTVRLFFFRGPGPEFSERDRALLTLLRPHLQEAYVEAERRRSPVPDLTPRQWELLRLIAAGSTNIQIARQLGLSEGTVRTHLENIYGRLDVSNRTAAVAAAFPERAA